MHLLVVYDWLMSRTLEWTGVGCMGLLAFWIVWISLLDEIYLYIPVANTGTYVLYTLLIYVCIMQLFMYK